MVIVFPSSLKNRTWSVPIQDSFHEMSTWWITLSPSTVYGPLVHSVEFYFLGDNTKLSWLNETTGKS